MRLAVLLSLVLTSPLAAQIMDREKEARLKTLLPTLADDELNAAIRSSEVLWYTNAEMPAAFQHAVGNGYVQTTFHSAFHNFSGDADERTIRDANGELGGGNGNREFPWNVSPGGAHNAKGVLSFKGLLLPKDADGRRLPVVWFRQDVPGRGGRERIIRAGGGLAEGRRSDYNLAYGWTYPIGTRFFEVLTMQTPYGNDVAFSVRVRIREASSWGVELFRPFATAQQLADALEDLPGADTRRQTAIRYLTQRQSGKVARLVDMRHRKRRAFDVTSTVVSLPEISTPDVLALLQAKPWPSCLGATWTKTDKGDVIAPTNERATFNFVPSNHWGAFAGNERESCMKCHDSTNQHVTVFEQPRGWYGRVRGSDGIFSFHPVEPASISSNGGAVPVRIRQSLIDGGFVAAYDPRIHKQAYRRIRGLY